MDALDLLVDFASSLANSTTIPKAVNAALDARKTGEPPDSIKRHESPAIMSIKQAGHLIKDQHAISPRGSLPIEVFLSQTPRSEQPRSNNEMINLDIHPVSVHSERPKGPGHYVEPYAIEHATTAWNPQDFPDDQPVPPLWMNMHEFGAPLQPDKFAWAPYPPLFRKIPGGNGIGQMVVAGNEIYQPPCGTGICNCRDLPPELANPIPTPAYERYEAGSLFRDNARGTSNDMWTQWH
jgi:hypothetical protein